MLMGTHHRCSSSTLCPSTLPPRWHPPRWQVAAPAAATAAAAAVADLSDPTTLPATMVGINAVIDCATARPEESAEKVDWEGKVALIQCAQACANKS
eukprot:1158957-Pelagomonas_calceolata.AAC.2